MLRTILDMVNECLSPVLPGGSLTMASCTSKDIVAGRHGERSTRKNQVFGLCMHIRLCCLFYYKDMETAENTTVVILKGSSFEYLASS